MKNTLPKITPTLVRMILAILLLVTINSSVYTVAEGHVGIVKRFGEAQKAVEPGLHAKLPFADDVEELEIRTRKNVEVMPSATSEQMPVTVAASVNWTITRSSALDLYKKYGGLDQFEERILDTRFRAAVKTFIPHFTAEKLIQDRSTAMTLIEDSLVEMLKDFPVKVDSIQIENIELPPVYLESIQTKQTEKNLAEAETFKLARQNSVAQQAVNTANAERDAVKAKADGEAYRIRETSIAEADAITIRGKAEASAIKDKTLALGVNPMLVELTKAEAQLLWDGALPKTMMGSTPDLLLKMGK